MIIRGVDMGITVRGGGIPFIWAHGLMSSRKFDDEIGLFDWSSLEDILKIVRYDARGHGESDATYEMEDYQWINLAADMVGVADAIGVNYFIAGGASMGCATSILAALAAPERIRGLVLVSPPTAWETRAAQRGILEQLANIVESNGLSALVPLLKKNPLLPKFLLDEVPEIEASFLRHVLAQNNRMVPYLLHGSAVSNLPPRQTLKYLKIPALILAWSGDPTHPISTSEGFNVILPNSVLHVANDVNETKDWSNLLRDFVKNLL